MAREKIVDEQAAHELYLFAVNDSGLYRQRILPIIANLQKKIAKGTYDSVLALKLWKYAADDAAQRYTREFGEGTGYGVFTPSTRRETAAHLADHYMEHLHEKKNPRRRGGSLLADHARAIAPKRKKARKGKSWMEAYEATRPKGKSRIALQMQTLSKEWITLGIYPNTAAGKKEARLWGERTHKKVSLPIRAIVI